MLSPKRRILILSTTFFPDKQVAAIRMTQWCRLLPEHGWKPYVVCRYYGFEATPEELTAKVHPEVSVVVTEVRSFKVAVIGQVPKPDRFELRSAATVMDVLAMAGGFTEFAARSRIVVIRANGDKTERIPFDYDKVRSGDGGQDNFRLRPGDIVVVP